MNITTQQIIEAIEAGFPVTVIINGEYYDYNPQSEQDNKSKESK